MKKNDPKVITQRTWYVFTSLSLYSLNIAFDCIYLEKESVISSKVNQKMLVNGFIAIVLFNGRGNYIFLFTFALTTMTIPALPVVEKNEIDGQDFYDMKSYLSINTFVNTKYS